MYQSVYTGIEERHGRHCGFSMWKVDGGGRLSEIGLEIFQMGPDVGGLTPYLGIVGRGELLPTIPYLQLSMERTSE